MDLKQFTDNRPLEAMQFRQTTDFSVRETDGKFAVSLVAFSGGELYHWWWGRCIFDRSGAVIAKKKIPLDYQHNPREVLGFLDTFTGEKALECSGYFVPFQKDDRASEILYKKEKGVPYQCSVSLGQSVFLYEYIPLGQTVTVNGEEYSTADEGLIVFREYEIDGVAICLYGSDSNTALFNKGNQPLTAREGQKDSFTMNDKKETVPADLRELAKKFSAKFGNELGFQYFSEGLSEADATEKHREALFAELKARDDKIAELTAKIAALSADFEKKKDDEEEEGEKKPVKEEEYAALKADFARLQESVKRLQGAGGGDFSGSGETTPVPADSLKAKKEFSVLPKHLQGYAEHFMPSNP